MNTTTRPVLTVKAARRIDAMIAKHGIGADRGPDDPFTVEGRYQIALGSLDIEAGESAVELAAVARKIAFGYKAPR